MGTGIGLNNKEVLDQIVKIANQFEFPLKLMIQPERPFDVTRNILSSAKLTYASGWKPQTTLQVGLEKTWAWVMQRGRNLA